MNFEEELPIDQYAQNGPSSNQNKSDIKTARTMGVVAIIVSFICCLFYGIPGLVTGIISLVLADSAKKRYTNSEVALTDAELSDIKTARVLGLVSIILSALTLVFFLIIIALSATGYLEETLGVPNY